MGHMVDRKHRDFDEEDIQKLADTFTAFQNGTFEDVKGFCAVASLEDIAKQDYILTPGRYVGIEEQEDDGEPFEERWQDLLLNFRICLLNRMSLKMRLEEVGGYWL